MWLGPQFHASTLMGISNRASWLFVLGAAACGETIPPLADGAPEPDAEAPADAAPICDPQGVFGAAVAVGGLATAGQEGSATLSPDERTVYFEGILGGASWDLYTAQRGSTSEAFGTPTLLVDASSASSDDYDPTLADDGLTLVFAATRDTGSGRLHAVSRGSTDDSFGAASPIAGVEPGSSSEGDYQPYLRADGEELWFSSNRAGGTGGFDTYRAVRTGVGFATPVEVSELDTDADDWNPVISSDGLTVYLGSLRAGGAGGYDIWTSHRSSVGVAFPPPTVVSELGTAADEFPSWLSADGCRLYLATIGEAGSFDVSVATRTPR